ncbi:hatching enzyme 1.2-like [Hydractinia symbiolongicarpus]|uniref:hatching enzyme 1.2-like n=1 Tax=Hydractinia symbiolongicarpus TaxID=13093 RepID=UPI00254C945B|nr:hatching enzyme 1.2-like [Hydractinia symbiolongicarpus]
MKSITVALLLLASCLSVRCVWVKEMENPGVFEGDMVLDPDEKEGVWKTGNAFASIKGGRWPGAKIPYVVEGSISSRGISAINAAIADYHKYTCLRFHRRTNERSYISFYRGGGCSSPVGYRYGRTNRISLASGCWNKGIVMHEIGHSIGIYHEQSRPDRDDFVRILWNNIPRANAFNFNKQKASNINSLGTPYDFRSMMHYSSGAFGGGRRTIEAKDRANQNLMGQRNGFSAIDVKQINLMYCGGSGPSLPPPTCENRNSRCDEWANRGECNKNPNYMLKWCKKACNVC